VQNVKDFNGTKLHVQMATPKGMGVSTMATLAGPMCSVHWANNPTTPSLEFRQQELKAGEVILTKGNVYQL